MEPIDPRLWEAHQELASRSLPENFAHRVLREARASRPASKAPSVTQMLLIPLAAAAACLAVTILIHNEWIDHNENLARKEWKVVAAETDTLGDL